MEHTRFKHEDWARVRFGAGTPWRRCWFVVSPPDEKEVQKARKTMKRQSAYDRSPPLIRGDIKFYESKKTKRSKPMATITNAYAAYAIYPQAVPLIDQSTLVKIEGTITIHSPPFQSSSEGLVFVMPETHAAVSGFETMLRFLVPTFDTFHLYGRPTRLIAATNHIKSIMFAFPKSRRYGYMEVLDIANLMQAPDSLNWNEGQWRQQLKQATMNRLSAGGGSAASSISSSKPRYRASMPNRHSNMPVGGPRLFSPVSDVQPSLAQSADNIIPEIPRNGSPGYHSQGSSDFGGLSAPLRPPKIRSNDSPVSSVSNLADERPGTGSTTDRRNAENEWRKYGFHQTTTVREDLVPPSPPAPVSSPPAFVHGPGETPLVRPRPSRDATNANNRMSNATFMQLTAAGNMGAVGAGRSPVSLAARSRTDGFGQQHVPTNTSPYPSGARGLGVSDVNWRASSEVVASPSPVASSSTHHSGGTPPINKNRLSLDTGKAIKRKPAPPVGVTSPAAEPSLEDLRHTLDEDVLNKIAPHQQSATSPSKDSRQDEESVYDDMSAASPDYSSTHESIYSGKESVKSAQQPRMGVMKTVGGGPIPQRGVVIGDAHYPVEQPPPVTFRYPTCGLWSYHDLSAHQWTPIHC